MKKLFALAATASLFLAAPAEARPTLRETTIYGSRVTVVDQGLYNWDTLVVDGPQGTETIAVLCVDGGNHDWESWGYMHESQRYYQRFVDSWCVDF